jgi:hypothetical protein
MKGFFGVVFWFFGHHWEFLGSPPRFTWITGGTAMLRLPGFISLVGLLILMSGNATQPAQAQTTLPRFNLVGNAVRLEDRLRLTGNEGLQTGAAWLVDKQQVQDGFEATFGWQINRANPRRGADGFASKVLAGELSLLSE